MLVLFFTSIDVANSASLLPSSFLRNLKRARAKVVSGGGDGNQRMGTMGDTSQGLVLLDGVVCVSGDQGSRGSRK